MPRNACFQSGWCAKKTKSLGALDCWWHFDVYNDGVEIQANIGTGEKNQPRYDEFFELCGCKWCLENV